MFFFFPLLPVFSIPLPYTIIKHNLKKLVFFLIVRQYLRENIMNITKSFPHSHSFDNILQSNGRFYHYFSLNSLQISLSKWSASKN